MDRTTVYEYSSDDDYGRERAVGWFDYDSAERFAEDTWFDGHNNISRATGSQWNHEMLFRTKGGRWVLWASSQYQDVPSRWFFVDAENAREWLARNGHHEAVAAHFDGGDVDEEGPQVGRPAIGPAVQVRFPEELLASIDTAATAAGITRAEMVRSLVRQGIVAE